MDKFHWPNVKLKKHIYFDYFSGEFGVKVILEYLRSLNDFQIPVQELNDLLITCLLQEKHGLSRLHYLLQYRVLADSKPLVTRLSLKNIFFFFAIFVLIASFAYTKYFKTKYFRFLFFFMFYFIFSGVHFVGIRKCLSSCSSTFSRYA